MKPIIVVLGKTVVENQRIDLFSVSLQKSGCGKAERQSVLVDGPTADLFQWNQPGAGI